ncbi:hypothetical protein ACAG96_05520 [Candidatus Izemoplasma sp. B36]|uniref:hypothetical protein n=1 Tax=Candidatus Izemoplasma sp. B36 TaxID=3242468 RepID=UPI0035579561
MIRDFLNKVFNTEFLPMSEVRKIKVWLVMGFLAILTIITIPYSAFFDYSLAMKIITISVLFLLMGFMYLLVRIKKPLLAIQLSIIYSILLMLYYTQGVNSFYAYIFFYISLSIIIFYQELFSYLVYGTIVLVVGGYYTVAFRDGLVTATDITGAAYVYLAILILFYIINLIHILHNEKIYTDLNYDWVKMTQVIHSYQDDILYYLEDIRQDAHKAPIYENLEFQKAAFELSEFIAKQILKDGSEIVNLMDLYVYIHEKGLNNLLKNSEISVSMKKISNMLGKYLLSENTDMFSMIINFYIRFQETDEYKENRYSYQIEDITDYKDEQVIAFCLIYSYLTYEIEKDKMWKQIERLDEDVNIFENIELKEFFSNEVIAFYNDNYEMIVNHFSEKK